MKPLSPVIWHEGMYLAQHHFQAQNRYFENSINFALSNLFFKSYGVTGLELDAEALQNGTVSLITTPVEYGGSVGFSRRRFT